MSVQYRECAAVLEPGRKLRVSLRVTNETAEAWRASEGWRVGYHLFDAETGTLIVDGERAPAEVAAGDEQAFGFLIDVPPEDGDFQIFVSPMQEGVSWQYANGWPFVLVEVKVRNEAAEAGAPRVATAFGLNLRRGWRATGRALTYPVLTVWRNRSLIRVMVRRDILGRYRGSFFGALWTVMNPLLLMATYFFVFGVVLRSRFEGDPSRTGFALNLLAGMLPWLAFSEAAGRAPTVMLEHRNFVKKLVFAVETLPFNLVASGLVSELFAVVIYSLALVLLGRGVPASVVWLPLLLVPQVMFTAGVSWLLAAMGAFLRDLGQVIGFVLTLWFFMTPICYPEASLPREALPLMAKNPIFVLVRGYRAIFLQGHAPEFTSLWHLWVVAAVVFVAGHACFYKLRKAFADEL